MKHIVFFIFLTFFAANSHAQLNTWRWQNPLPEGNSMQAVQMISPKIIYACGDNRSFVKTTDGGDTWEVKTNVGDTTALQPDVYHGSITFRAISFLDANTGMVCGDSGDICKTTDGGETWLRLKSKTFVAMRGVVMVDENIAIAVGATALVSVPGVNGILTRTTDGGKSWLQLPTETDDPYASIRKLRPDFIVITGFGGLVRKSVDSGQTWTKIYLPVGNTILSGCFFNDTTATLIGELGAILKTSNGGNSWVNQKSDSLIITATLNTVDGKDQNILAIVGTYGTIVYTTNGGTNWQQSQTGTWDAITGLSFYDRLNAIAVGNNGTVLRTTDGGQTWVFLPNKPNTTIFYGVAFPKGDTSLGIAVGNNGAIMRTTNGGKDWNIIPCPTDHLLRGVAFMDSMNVIAVGEYGTILKSTDGGLTWNFRSSNTSLRLRSVSFATPQDGITVGDFNTVLRTYDGGEYWTRQFASFRDTDYMNSVSFPDLKHAFISGTYTYYTSSDGGANWLRDPKFYNIWDTSAAGIAHGLNIYGMSFADSLHGGIFYAAYKEGINVKTTSDGGNTWGNRLYLGPVNLPNTRELNMPNGMQYYDVNRLTVVGNAGYIVHSSNGGVTWMRQESNTLNNLYAVCFGTSQAGTAVGNKGNIIRITTDEIPSAVHNNYSPSSGQKIVIDGNYPNPFSAFTTIQYNLLSSGFTTIEVYSVEGKPRAILAQEYQTSGDHNIQFNAAELASGTYFCRITNNGMTAELPMVVQK